MLSLMYRPLALSTNSTHRRYATRGRGLTVSGTYQLHTAYVSLMQNCHRTDTLLKLKTSCIIPANNKEIVHEFKL